VHAPYGAVRTPDHPAASDATATVLLVEDEPSIRRFAGQVLRAAGYRVITAEDGPAALALAAAHTGAIDVLVTDLDLPEMTGGEVAHAVRARYPAVRILYASGSGPQDGVVGPPGLTLDKPYDTQALTAAVREALGNA
jgi:two-component system, cell cycle sensor histidine kinase and response regulator CckA